MITNTRRCDNLKVEKIRAEIGKLIANTAYIDRQNLAYLIIITATATIAIAAFVKLFL